MLGDLLSKKVAAGVSVFIIGVVLTLATGLYFCYNKVIAVESDNKMLRLEVLTLAGALKDEVQRGEAVAAVTARLEENDEKRQGQFLRFSRSLTSLKQTSADIRDALGVVVPRASLVGLRSFGTGSGGQGGASARAFDKTDDVSDK